MLYGEINEPGITVQQLDAYVATHSYKGAYPSCEQPLGLPGGHLAAIAVFQRRVGSTWATFASTTEYSNLVGGSNANTGLRSARVSCGASYRVVGGHKAFLVGALRQSLTVGNYSSCFF